ncbi:putative membrane protein [Francisella philomiragia]|uniref:hypothetical protein n=1 Tax=Francisella philomiragia TaxID=28110 RepID=UPI0005A56D52|nr:hypothetical protein [Francisella philomiragia]AJI57701.1 putative membrane protein [Francisella philomiragia]MBK2026228.1 hypothetical protein [Francisella philomiragia]
MEVLNKKSELDIYIISTVCIVGIAVSLACNLVYFFWYKIDVFGYTFIFSLAGFFYPITFAVVDLIAYLKKGFFPIFIAIVMRLADGLFSNIPSLSETFQNHAYMPPDSLKHLSNSVTALAPNLSSLWYHGVIVSTITVVTEILIFKKILKIFNNAPLAIIMATSLTIFVHNMLLDYSMLKSFDNHWNIIFGNYILNILMVSLYALIVAVILKVRKQN